MDSAVRGEVISLLARTPECGDLIPGTHGLRKLRHARPGGGKSGGFRVIFYFHSHALPVFLITVFGKNQKANLTRAEAAILGGMVKVMAAEYRKVSGK